ncbi:MAG: RagB/SusD family nutrient uptake outer membrane protein [Bacteroidales bacterium]|jgi:hypothetical protein|nr:RagB/SusD family nutrient uptake outer membrane protein [Bacteroidales bacterium]
MKKIKIIYLLIAGCLSFSCSDYLDVVPEGTSRLENAFTLRSEAERYLFTCYSYMPKDGNPSSDPTITGGDEMWTLTNPPHPTISLDGLKMAQGLQSATVPLFDKWNGLYQALRDCNIFLENVSKVPDIEEEERIRWIAEVKTLKAYYHFCLMRMYGPIPIIRENLPVDAGADEVKVVREPIDSCVFYMVQLLNEAIPDLPSSITNKTEQLGRICRPIAASLKAKILVTAASPLFNGNTDQATLLNRDKAQLFNQTYMPEKWDSAVIACKKAIDLCHEAGAVFYKYPGTSQYNLTDTMLLQLTLRNAICDRWNDELIWGNSQSIQGSLQNVTVPKLEIQYRDYAQLKSVLGIPIKIVEQFYTHNGVPINEDKTWGGDRYALQVADGDDKLYIKQGATTVKLHFDREPRFYAWIGFDEGIWYGQGKLDDKKPNDLYVAQCKNGQLNGIVDRDFGPVTGYYPKKYVHYESTYATSAFNTRDYPFPIMRLSDLYLLYAEALNEAADNETNRNDALTYVNMVRDRAGLPSVEDAWDNFSSNPTKYKSQLGLRQIIQQERLIELSFEGHRFWDIRRWKTAMEAYNTPIRGWDLKQSQPEFFYKPIVLQKQNFGIKDYFWPIRESNITTNRNLVQNIGW